MPKLFFAIPGDIEARTGGYGYDRRLIAALPAQGWQVEHLAWPGTFPFPSAADRAEVAASLAACPDQSVVMVDGLALGAMPELAEAERDRLRLVALVHHPLGLEAGLSRGDRTRLLKSERKALGTVRAIIVTSDTTAETLTAEFGVPADMVTVAKPGTDPVPPFPRKSANGSAALLSVGTVNPRKGHDILVEALARISDLPWTLTIAGSLTRAPDTAAALVRQIAFYGLTDRITLAGEVADPVDLYRAADIFVLPSRYEGYGMVFAEALSHGLPIVATTAGAIPETVPAAAGLLVPPDDAPALANALGGLIGDPRRRRMLAEAAFVAGGALPSWRDTAEIVSDALLRV